MIRIALPEAEDSGRLPRWLRDAMTGYLQAAISLGKPYATIAPVLADLLRTSSPTRVVDLASGGGGPWPALVEGLKSELGAYPTVTLTDIQPNLGVVTELERLPRVSYRRDPISALAVPPDLEGVRTMFTGLHHFDEGEVTQLLRSAQDAKVPFLAAEATHRSVRGLLVTAIVSTAGPVSDAAGSATPISAPAPHVPAPAASSPDMVGWVRIDAEELSGRGTPGACFRD